MSWHRLQKVTFSCQCFDFWMDPKIGTPGPMVIHKEICDTRLCLRLVACGIIFWPVQKTSLWWDWMGAAVVWGVMNTFSKFTGNWAHMKLPIRLMVLSEFLLVICFSWHVVDYTINSYIFNNQWQVHLELHYHFLKIFNYSCINGQLRCTHS